MSDKGFQARGPEGGTFDDLWVLHPLPARRRRIPTDTVPKLVAGALAALVAWLMRSVFATLVVGMASLWLLQLWL
jgi:branched-subunit amino acid transport protein